ncbi:hypothetical protein [Pyrodictium abyssi]|uniref:hypothetical protein n=1 Tax=Pyrodictium abyssi TaxID=54256 RepID=UPI0030C6C05D
MNVVERRTREAYGGLPPSYCQLCWRDTRHESWGLVEQNRRFLEETLGRRLDEHLDKA